MTPESVSSRDRVKLNILNVCKQICKSREEISPNSQFNHIFCFVSESKLLTIRSGRNPVDFAVDTAVAVEEVADEEIDMLIEYGNNKEISHTEYNMILNFCKIDKTI